jgi:hypothetical protein
MYNYKETCGYSCHKAVKVAKKNSSYSSRANGGGGGFFSSGYTFDDGFNGFEDFLILGLGLSGKFHATEIIHTICNRFFIY